MRVVERLARYLAAKLNLPFEGNGDDSAAVFFGCMPDEPARAICVYAGDLRAPGDPEGARVRVMIRSDADCAWPLDVAEEILCQLDERRDLLLAPEGGYVVRVETERGFEFTGMSEDDLQYYAADFRVYTCP